MKRGLLTLLAVALAAGMAGCCGPHSGCLTSWLPGSCSNCPETGGGCTGEYGSCGSAGCGQCGEGNPGVSGLFGADSGGYAGCGGQGCRVPCRAAFTPGPPTAAVTYPYYTVRGPRDFLAANPPGIGP